MCDMALYGQPRVALCIIRSTTLLVHETVAEGEDTPFYLYFCFITMFRHIPQKEYMHEPRGREDML